MQGFDLLLRQAVGGDAGGVGYAEKIIAGEAEQRGPADQDVVGRQSGGRLSGIRGLKFLDLPPVSLRNLQSTTVLNSPRHTTTELRGISLRNR